VVATTLLRSASLRSPGRPSKSGASDLSDLVVRTALISFRKFGYEATTIEAIAKSCNSSKHTIYRRFSSKAELFIAAIALDRQGVMAQFDAIDVSGLETLDALRTTTLALLDIALSPGSTDLYRACIGAVPKFPLIGEEFLVTENKIRALLEPLVERAQCEGKLVPGDTVALAGQLYYATIGEGWGHALMGRLAFQDRPARMALFEANWQMFLDGRRVRPAEETSAATDTSRVA
jgi:AcrR family transcriptional regulator